MQLRGFQGTHLGGVRLIQQDREFAENSARLPFIGLTAYPVEVGQQKPRAQALLSGHFRHSSQPIALVKWHYRGLFLMPLGIVWGNASRCYQQQGENISRQLSVLEIDIVLAHLNSPVDTE